MQGDKKDSELSSALARAMVNLSGKHISSIQFGESDTRTSGFWLDEIPQAGKLADIAIFLEIGRSKDVFVVIGFCVQFAVDWPSSLVWNTQCICVIVAVT